MIPECVETGDLRIIAPGAESTLYKSKAAPLVATGISSGSKISLFELNFNSLPCVSAFIYPTTYSLFLARIYELDGVFSEAVSLGTLRTFQEKTLEQVDGAFLAYLRTEVPLTSHRYQITVPIIHHGFPVELRDFLRERVASLRVD